MPAAVRASDSSISSPEIGDAQARLRPIVYGLSRVAPGESAAIVASVHGERDRLIGYVVIDRFREAASWAPLLAVPGLSVDDACLLARANTLQLAFASVSRGSAQCVLTSAGRVPESQRRTYLEALTPLTEGGILRVVFEGERDGPRRGTARAGLVASAVAATATVLERLRRRRAETSIGEYLPTGLSGEVARALEREGLGLRGSGPPGPDGVDVLVVGAPLWSLGTLEGRLLRSKLVVSLGTAHASAEAEQAMHDWGVALIPDTVAACGRFLALQLVEEGSDPQAALARTAELVSGRLAEALESSPRRPLTESLAALGNGTCKDL